MTFHAAGGFFALVAGHHAVREVVLDGAVLSALSDGAVFADLSTTSVALVRELADAARDGDIEVPDIEMSGSTAQVESGELVLLVGGDAAVLDRIRPFLDPIAKEIVHLGEHGAGAIGNLVANTVLGVEMQAMAEAIALGEAAGIDRNRLLDALETLAVVAPAHKSKLDNARNDDYPVAFPLRLMDKDFHLVLGLAHDIGLELPATEASARVCDAELAEETTDVDFSAVIRSMEQPTRDA